VRALRHTRLTTHRLMSIEAAKQFHALHVEPRIGAPVGASAADVEKLESKLGFPLPQAYRDYLLWMGRDWDGIFRGSAWFIDCIFSNHGMLRELLEEEEVEYQLKDSHVVFFSHQGYMAAWFDAESADPDPECWFMTDGLSEPRPSGRFSEALLNDMKGLAGAL